MTPRAFLLVLFLAVAGPALAKPGSPTGANAVPPEPARQRIGSPAVEKGKECADAHGQRISCTAVDAVPATPHPPKAAAAKPVSPKPSH
jgi:hypothetical protein